MTDERMRVVALRSDMSVSSYEPDVQERLYELWAGRAVMNCAAAVRLYEQEVEPGTPVPTVRTVQRWQHELGWDARIGDELQRNGGRTLYDMQMRDLLNYKRAGEEVSAVLAGEYRDDPLHAAIILKARELTGREFERRIRAALPALPKELVADFSKLSLEEQEAAMVEAIQAQKTGGGS